MTRRAAALAAWFALAAPGLLEAPEPDVEAGSAAYAAGRFDRALGHFERARPDAGDDDDRAAIEFDRGAARYKLGQGGGADAGAHLEAAERAFRAATEAQSGVLRSAAFHNLGNTLYQRGRFADAAAAYRRALRANPRNDDARYNLEMALRKLAPPPSPPPGQPPPSQPPPSQPPPGQPPPSQPPPGQPPPADGQPPPADGSRQPADAPPQDGQPQDAPPQDAQPSPSDGQPPPADAPSQPDRDAVAREQQHKLDRLEQRSKELRRRLLRGRGPDGYDRPRSVQDW